MDLLFRGFARSLVVFTALISAFFKSAAVAELVVLPLQPIYANNGATPLSAGGNVVLCLGDDGKNYLWRLTARLGELPIPEVAGAQYWHDELHSNDDATVIVGSGNVSGGLRAFSYRAGSGSVVDAPGVEMENIRVSPDGSVTIRAHSVDGVRRVFRHANGLGIFWLGNSDAKPEFVSEDANVLVGLAREAAGGKWLPAWWSKSGVKTTGTQFATQSNPDPDFCSRNGTYIVGTVDLGSYLPQGGPMDTSVFRWNTASGSVEYFKPLLAAYPSGHSRDGQVLVISGWDPSLKHKSVVYDFTDSVTIAKGPQDPKQWLADNGFLSFRDTFGKTDFHVAAFSHDRQRVVGSCIQHGVKLYFWASRVGQ